MRTIVAVSFALLLALLVFGDFNFTHPPDSKIEPEILSISAQLTSTGTDLYPVDMYAYTIEMNNPNKRLAYVNAEIRLLDNSGHVIQYLYERGWEIPPGKKAFSGGISATQSIPTL
jgi:hypothetical protein